VRPERDPSLSVCELCRREEHELFVVFVESDPDLAAQSSSPRAGAVTAHGHPSWNGASVRVPRREAKIRNRRSPRVARREWVGAIDPHAIE